MNRKSLAVPVLLALACLLPATGRAQAPAGATFQCKDGTYSTAKTASGACSRHGGVGKALTAAAAPATPSPSTALGGSAPAGATFQCKDGTYSTAKTASGACSRHGGVAQALTAARVPATPSPSATTGGGAAPANATFQCKDGSYSTAKTASGACSRHGGVAQALTAAPSPMTSPSTAMGGSAPEGATFQCKDGSYSMAKTSRGACSNHGGVAQSLTAGAAAAQPVEPSAAVTPPSTPSGQAPTVARPAGAPANATAKCKDGTYSESKQHSGTCSYHGGVAEWYQ